MIIILQCFSRNGKKFVDWWVIKCTSTLANISGIYRRMNVFIVNGPKKLKFRGYDGMIAYFGCHRGKLQCLYLVALGSKFLSAQKYFEWTTLHKQTDIDPNWYLFFLTAKLIKILLPSKFYLWFLPVLAHRLIGMSHLVLEVKSMVCRCMFFFLTRMLNAWE